LDIASLIFVYNEKIDIRFRMDEKRFDVDGAYNSYYEIIKKRLDKAHVKDSPNVLLLRKNYHCLFWYGKPERISGICHQTPEERHSGT
jgi:hypothetical protein